MKAGGIDLLDLMKEDLLAPAGSSILRDIPGLDTIERRATAACASARWSRWRGRHRTRSCARATRLCRRGGAPPARRSAMSRRSGGNLLQRPRCWYFRVGRLSLSAQGRRSLLCASRAKISIMRSLTTDFCAIVHPSTPATALGRVGRVIELVDARARRGGSRLDEFFVALTRMLSAKMISAPRNPDRHLAAAAAGERAHGAFETRREKSFDWPLVDVAVVLDLASGNACRKARSFLARSRRRRTARASPRRRSLASRSTPSPPPPPVAPRWKARRRWRRTPTNCRCWRRWCAAPCCAPPVKVEERAPCCPVAP